MPNKIIGPDGQDVLTKRPEKWEGNDVNHDGRKDLGRLVPGTYKFHFGEGKHAHYEYLRGDAKQVVQRDLNHDGYFTSQDVWRTDAGDTVIETGNFAILFHAADIRNTWSAACETIPPSI